MQLLRGPIIATGRGGSGTRLLSDAIQASGVFLGNRLNVSGDSVEWVDTIYDIVIKKELGLTPSLCWSSLLQDNAIGILGQSQYQTDQLWGFKLPEAMLVLPELFEAFPDARLLHLVRHPVAISLRRTHMTSRTSNPVGRVVLNAAYRAVGRDITLIESDGEYRNNALSWLYQVKRVAQFCRETLRSDQYLSIRFEDFCADPVLSNSRIVSFLGRTDSALPLALGLDSARAAAWNKQSDEVAAWVWDQCGTVAAEFGYGPDPRMDPKE